MWSYLRQEEIDKKKWDRLLDSIAYPHIYAQSWYLDIVSPNWSAMVYGDYSAVFPLTSRRKYGLHYIAQAPFCQRLGLLSKDMTVRLEDVLEQIPSKFIKQTMSFDLKSREEVKTSFIERTNNILVLNNTYQDVYAAFKSNAKRNIKKSANFELCIKEQSVKDFIHAKLLTIGNAKEKKELDILGLLHSNQSKESLYNIQCLKVSLSNENNLAGVYFVEFKDRVYYLSGYTTEKGKAKSAMFFLFNEWIKEHAGQKIILDFEGSSIPGIRRFFEGFGAKRETYYAYIFNRWSWLKLI